MRRLVSYVKAQLEFSGNEKGHNQTLSRGFKALWVTRCEDNNEIGLPFQEK